MGYRQRVAYHKGVDAETVAADFVSAKGYAILAKRYKTPHGEIDILAHLNTILVAIEVKKRTNLVMALESITSKQQHRIMNSVLFFQHQHPFFLNHDIRLDALVVLEDGAIHHLVNAWTA
jgi:putative endonuclease